MPRGLIKIKDRYFEWSTIVDAPVMPGMTIDELIEYHRNKYGEWSLVDLQQRLERVREKGCSFYLGTVDTYLSVNRAGPNEECLTADEIYERYTRSEVLDD